ncbi:hypothetical protein GCM10023322_31270 [Rugosimonospora acidiphila]|uniref:Phytase-like domain-containing protein n=1 Tax=Rugosimonospora acidiphila TaxID=556531 RepID=A0ABP9RU60_9ACTN
MSLTTSRRALIAAASTAAVVLTSLAATAGAAQAQPASAAHGIGGILAGRSCAPSALAVDFSDALDKLTYHGIEVGGLSSLAYDPRSLAWASTVDNHASDPARIWFFRNPANPVVVRDPLVLKRPDGTPYDGTNSDNEGLAVLPNGDYVVSSETEPSIRIFGRDGVQKSSLPVPARFAVTGTTPAGQATSNATLEGLTITPSGTEIIASMEGALSGDVAANGDATLHRFLVYDADRHGNWTLTKQVAYRAQPGNRIAEATAYGRDSLLVEEASFNAPVGNDVQLYAVTGLSRAKNVSAVTDLATAPAADVVRKSLVADLVKCPTLGAPSRQTQANPLLDNYEGMAVTADVAGFAGVSLISDDNFGATQYTRVLNLVARLP